MEFESGSRQLVDLVLDMSEQMKGLTVYDCSIRLSVLVSMNCTKATALDGLEQGILPMGGTTDKDVRRDYREWEMVIGL